VGHPLLTLLKHTVRLTSPSIVSTMAFFFSMTLRFYDLLPGFLAIQRCGHLLHGDSLLVTGLPLFLNLYDRFFLQRKPASLPIVFPLFSNYRGCVFFGPSRRLGGLPLIRVFVKQLDKAVVLLSPLRRFPVAASSLFPVTELNSECFIGETDLLLVLFNFFTGDSPRNSLVHLFKCCLLLALLF